MRLIFKDVPAIYGFSSVAPLGPDRGLDPAAPLPGGRHRRDRHRARQRRGCSAQFSAHAMTVTLGHDAQRSAGARIATTSASSPTTASRAEARLAFVHELLERETARGAHVPATARAVRGVARRRRPRSRRRSPRRRSRDRARRRRRATRYLELARDADAAAVRARMIALARKLGWLSPDEERDELARMFDEQLARNAITPAEVDLVCTLNKDRDARRRHATGSTSRGDADARAAVRRCSPAWAAPTARARAARADQPQRGRRAVRAGLPAASADRRARASCAT